MLLYTTSTYYCHHHLIFFIFFFFLKTWFSNCSLGLPSDLPLSGEPDSVRYMRKFFFCDAWPDQKVSLLMKCPRFASIITMGRLRVLYNCTFRLIWHFWLKQLVKSKIAFIAYLFSCFISFFITFFWSINVPRYLNSVKFLYP